MAGYDEGREWQEITARDAAAYAADVAADAAMMAEAEAAQAAHIAAEDARIAGALVQVGPYTYADPQCRQCRGTGVVWDTVDYGSTTARLESPCDCQIDYLWAIEDGDGIALERDGHTYDAARQNDTFHLYERDEGGEYVNVWLYQYAPQLLRKCATIAPLTAWAVVWDDQGADDAPRY